jgi:hypothetical protein
VGLGDDIALCSRLNGYNLTISAGSTGAVKNTGIAGKESFIELALYKR